MDDSSSIASQQTVIPARVVQPHAVQPFPINSHPRKDEGSDDSDVSEKEMEVGNLNYEILLFSYLAAKCRIRSQRGKR